MNYTYYRRYQPERHKRKGFSSFFWMVVFLVLAAVFLKSCFGVVSSKNEEKRDEAILTLEKGDAQVNLWGESEAEMASNAQIIVLGDSVKTLDDSYAVLSFYNGSEVRLDENTMVTFSDSEKSDANIFVTLQLNEGRVYVDQESLEEVEFQLKVLTNVMNIISSEGAYLASNGVNGEFVQVLDEELSVELVDRDESDVIIDNVILTKGEKLEFGASKIKSLLARETVTLAEPAEENFGLDEFYLWFNSVDNAASSSTGEVVESMETLEADIVDVENEQGVASEVDTSSISIRVDSPASPATINKDAIAIEGSVVSGNPSRVTVTWGGNNQVYTLAGFKAGDTNFRYVADFEYKNLSKGENTYTVVAYDENGNASNTVVLSINVNSS